MEAAAGCHGLAAFAAVAFLAIRWSAVDFSLRPLRLSVNWLSLWTTERAIGFSGVVGPLAHLAYPLMMRLDDASRRRVALTLAITANLGLLGFSKYFNFFADTFSQLWQSVFGVPPDLFTVRIILPVGISFYTFQSMAYTIDLYRKKLEPQPEICSSMLRTFRSSLNWWPVRSNGRLTCSRSSSVPDPTSMARA